MEVCSKSTQSDSTHIAIISLEELISSVAYLDVVLGATYCVDREGNVMSTTGEQAVIVDHPELPLIMDVEGHSRTHNHHLGYGRLESLGVSQCLHSMGVLLERAHEVEMHMDQLHVICDYCIISSFLGAITLPHDSSFHVLVEKMNEHTLVFHVQPPKKPVEDTMKEAISSHIISVSPRLGAFYLLNRCTLSDSLGMSLANESAREFGLLSSTGECNLMVRCEADAIDTACHRPVEVISMTFIDTKSASPAAAAVPASELSSRHRVVHWLKANPSTALCLFHRCSFSHCVLEIGIVDKHEPPTPLSTPCTSSSSSSTTSSSTSCPISGPTSSLQDVIRMDCDQLEACVSWECGLSWRQQLGALRQLIQRLSAAIPSGGRAEVTKSRHSSHVDIMLGPSSGDSVPCISQVIPAGCKERYFTKA